MVHQNLERRALSPSNPSGNHISAATTYTPTNPMNPYRAVTHGASATAAASRISASP